LDAGTFSGDIVEVRGVAAHDDTEGHHAIHLAPDDAAARCQRNLETAGNSDQLDIVVGDAAVGASHARDLKLVARFKKDTGINVKLVPHPSASDASYQQLARAFSSKSSSIDVAMLRAVTDTIPRSIQPAEALVRTMRDKDRY